jgi:hypothetical protein
MNIVILGLGGDWDAVAEVDAGACTSRPRWAGTRQEESLGPALDSKQDSTAGGGVGAVRIPLRRKVVGVGREKW